MPRSADETRRRILDAAERRFAIDGITAATFAEILAEAGQRNNSAIQYHFGDRMGLIEAITARRVEQMAVHRDALVDALPPDVTVRQLVEVIIEPLAAMLVDPGGSAYLRIQAELLAHPDRVSLPPMLADPVTRPGVGRVIDRLRDVLPERLDDHADLRADLTTSLIFHALADRARASGPDVDHAEFVAALVCAVVAILETPMALGGTGAELSEVGRR